MSAFRHTDNKRLSEYRQTSTTGVELIFDQRRILGSKFDFMFNGTWMNAKVEKGPIVNFTDRLGQPANYRS